jgi:hypothetical protein
VPLRPSAAPAGGDRTTTYVPRGRVGEESDFEALRDHPDVLGVWRDNAHRPDDRAAAGD